MKSTQEIAQELVKHCRSGEFHKAYELYDENCVSIEPKGAQLELAEGMDAIRAKGEQWNAMVEEFHSSEVSEPIVAANFFSLTMNLEVTFKGAGRTKMEEVCVYEVQNGKVVKEQFFYPIAPQQ